MKQITAIFETPERAEEAIQRMRQAYDAKQIRLHSRPSPGSAYHTGKPFSDFFVPTPQFNPGGDIMYPQTFNFAALEQQEQKREEAIRSAKALLSMEIAEEDAGNAAAALRSLGGSDVTVGE